jgi:hypothetical protein
MRKSISQDCCELANRAVFRHKGRARVSQSRKVPNFTRSSFPTHIDNRSVFPDSYTARDEMKAAYLELCFSSCFLFISLLIFHNSKILPTFLL